MSKPVIVFTNDPEKPKTTLSVIVDVDKVVSISPQFVRINGKVSQKLSAKVTIAPTEKYAFSIISSEIIGNGEENILVDITSLSRPSGTSYILTIDNIKATPGSYLDTILLRTDSEVRPEIEIKVYGNITAEIPQEQESGFIDE
ncbi:MAG: hypothetical protein K9L30_11945 [Desulfobacterales bacterium]|nr:hypothetical protein [Desulfobacterales bacterium]